MSISWVMFNKQTGFITEIRTATGVSSEDDLFRIVYGAEGSVVAQSLCGAVPTLDNIPLNGSKKVDLATKKIIDNPDYSPPPPVVEPALQ